LLVAPSALCGSPVLAQGKTGLPVLPSAMDAIQSLSVHTAAVPCGFWLHWLTSQARYVRVLIPRRAMRASCESPWRVSAKHRILGACFPLTTPFRTRFSPCEMARTANVQRLIGCLYALWYCYIPTCRFHGTGSLSAKHHVLGACFSLMAPFRTRFSPCEVARTAYVQRLIGCLYILWYCYIPPCRCTAQCDLRAGPGSISIGMNGSSGSIIPTHLRGIWSGKAANHLPALLPPTPLVTMFIGFMTAR
jgi:hypothetical protein